MFHKFDHYGNINCVFTRVYASLSNSLATLSEGLSFNINSGSFNFKWKLLEAHQLKWNKKNHLGDYFDSSVFLWQLPLCHYILMVSQLELTFPNVHIGVPILTFCFADVNILEDVVLKFPNYFLIHESRDNIFENGEHFWFYFMTWKWH